MTHFIAWPPLDFFFHLVQAQISNYRRMRIGRPVAVL